MNRIAFGLLLLVAASFAQQKPEPSPPSLDATLNFMQNTLDRFGFIHTRGKDQELKLKGDNEPCRPTLSGR